MGLGAILNGHTNEMLGLNQNISAARIRLCKECKLYKRVWYWVRFVTVSYG